MIVLPSTLSRMDELSDWQLAERQFSAKSYDGAAPAGTTSGVLALPAIAGTLVVFTAPHAVNHRRNDQVKLADRGTGGLAVALHERAGVGALVTAQYVGGDANFDRSHPLKDLLFATRPQPRAVVDLHGMREGDGRADVVIGTSRDRVLGFPLGQVAKAFLEAEGLVVSIDEPFDACRATSVTRFAHDLGIPAIQLELAPTLRPPLWEPPRAKAVFRGLMALATEVSVSVTQRARLESA